MSQNESEDGAGADDGPAPGGRDVERETVLAVAALIGSTLDPADLFHGIAERLRAIATFERCAIARYDPGSGSHSYWYEADDLEVEHLRLDGTDAWEGRVVYETHAPYYVADLSAHPAGTRKRLLRAGLRSALVLPIVCAGECIAHISLSSRRVDAFSPGRIAQLETVSSLIGPAIRNARLYRESEERAARIALAGRIAQAVSSTLDPARVFETIVGEIRQSVGFDRCAIARRDPLSGHHLYWRVESDVDVRHLEDDEHDVWEGSIVYDVPQPHYVPDLTQASVGTRQRLIAAGLRSVLVVPIIRENRTFAHLSVSSRRVDAFSDADIELLQAVADHVASAIRNAILYDEVQQHRERLEELVRERTRDLEEAHEELLRSTRLATLGQLTATVSHELRNPLGTISNCLQSLRLRLGDGDPEIDRVAAMAQRNVQRCNDVIADLLDHSRIRLRDPRPTELGPWARQVLGEYALTATVPVEHALAVGAAAEIDPERMRRVLVNLLDNATDAAAAAGGEPVRVDLRRSGDRVELSVVDSGPGMLPDVLGRAFEPMFSTKSFGTGLGLFIVREIVAQHGGEIVLDSRPGEGTRVRVSLPAVAVPDAES